MLLGVEQTELHEDDDGDARQDAGQMLAADPTDPGPRNLHLRQCMLV